MHTDDCYIKPTCLEDLKPGLPKNQLDKSQSYTLLPKAIECLSKSSIENAKRNGNSYFKECRSIDAGENSEIEDAVELLREQVETLKQELRHKELELQQTEQELRYANQELSAALNSEPLTLDEAKKIARNILRGEKPAQESLAEILSAIYGSLVTTDELEPQDKSSLMTPLTSNRQDCLITQSQVLRDQLNVLGTQADEVKVRSKVLRNQADEVRVRSGVLRNCAKQLRAKSQVLKSSV